MSSNEREETGPPEEVLNSIFKWDINRTGWAFKVPVTASETMTQAWQPDHKPCLKDLALPYIMEEGAGYQQGPRDVLPGKPIIYPDPG